MKTTTKTAAFLREIWKYYQQSWNMKPDEFLLFVYFFQKASKSNYKEFYASINDIEWQVRIGRKRQETIIKKFKSQGWLTVSNKFDNEGCGPYRTFYVNVKQLADKKVLIELFNPCDDLAELFQEISKVL